MTTPTDKDSSHPLDTIADKSHNLLAKQIDKYLIPANHIKQLEQLRHDVDNPFKAADKFTAGEVETKLLPGSTLGNREESPVVVSVEGTEFINTDENKTHQKPVQPGGKKKMPVLYLRGVQAERFRQLAAEAGKAGQLKGTNKVLVILES